MRMIQHEVLRRHVIPNAAARARNGEIHVPRTARGQAGRAGILVGTAAAPALMMRRAPLRVAATIFFAVLGAKTFNRTLAQRSVLGALFRGSVAAGAAYVQDRHARAALPTLETRSPEPSALSVYAVAGLGLGLGALFANRRRR